MGALFDADGDQIDYGDATILDAGGAGLAALTASWWMKVTGAGGNIISKWGPTAATDQALLLSSDAGGDDLTIAVTNGGGSAYLIKTTTDQPLDPADTWIQVIADWATPNDAHVYVGNVLATFNAGTATSPNVINPNTTNAFCLGMRTVDSSAAARMALAEVGIWNRVLDAGERATLQTDPPSAVASGLLLYAPLESDTVSVTGPQPTGSTGITFPGDHPFGAGPSASLLLTILRPSSGFRGD